MSDEMMNIVFDQKMVRDLVDAVAQAEVPPMIMFREDMDAMRAEAEDLKERHYIQVLRVLKAYPFWDTFKYFSDKP